MKKIIVSDVTLRAIKEENKKVLTFREKLTIASLIAKTGVNAIELPLISNSKEDNVIYRTIVESVGNSTVCVPCDILDGSVENAYEIVKTAKNFFNFLPR